MFDTMLTTLADQCSFCFTIKDWVVAFRSDLTTTKTTENLHDILTLNI
jgi:hypothetical protein